MDSIQDTRSDIMLCNINPFSVKQLNRTLDLQDSYEKLIRDWTMGDGNNSREENVTLNEIQHELLTGRDGKMENFHRGSNGIL